MANNDGMPQGLLTVLKWIIGLAVAALILVIMLIIFGNLSGNLGFAEGSQGFNDTQSVILNYSQSAVNVSAQFPTVGTIIGLAILLLVLIGILAFAIKAMMGIAANPTSSVGSFG